MTAVATTSVGTRPTSSRVPTALSNPSRPIASAPTTPAPGALGCPQPRGWGWWGRTRSGPEALLNAVGTRELAGRVPTLVVATAVKLVPGEVFGRLGGPGFEVVPLEAVAAVVVGPEVLSPAEAGRRATGLSGVASDAGQELVGGGVGAEFAGGDLVGEGVEGFAVAELAELGAEVGQGDLLDLAGGPVAAAAFQLAAGGQVGAVGADGLDQLVDPVAALGHGQEHRDLPGAGLAQVEHLAEVAGDHLGAVAVGLVDHEHVGHLEDAGLGDLHGVAEAGGQGDQGGVGQRGHLDLGLADPDRLDQDDVAAGARPAPAPPGGSPRPGRPGGPGWPSSGCRRRRRGRGAASGPGRRAGPRR